MSKRTAVWPSVVAVTLAASPTLAIVVDGTISDVGWGGDYTRWTSEVFMPNTTPVLIEGWVELTSLTSGGAIMVGLLDKQWVDGGSSGYMGGAYAYFANVGVNRVGPSDGNFGGEIVDTFVDLVRNPGGPNLVPFSMLISAGSIEVTLGVDTLTDTYGVIKAVNSTTAYAWDEFQYGAYLGIDLWAPSGSVTYSLTATEQATDSVPEPTTLALLTLGGLALLRRRRKL